MDSRCRTRCCQAGIVLADPLLAEYPCLGRGAESPMRHIRNTLDESDIAARRTLALIGTSGRSKSRTGQRAQLRHSTSYVTCSVDTAEEPQFGHLP